MGFCCCNRSICAQTEWLASSLLFGGAATVHMFGKVNVREVCAAVTGYQQYVPCRLCTAWVPRFDLEPGLLPEETHHDAPTLTKFGTEERQRRVVMAEKGRKEINSG